MTLVIQALVDGLLIGGVYAAIGMGLSLAYGVMGVVNWMHGEVLMVSMYISFYLVKYGGFDPYLTAIVTVAVTGVFGFLLQKYVLNNLIRQSKMAWRDILLFTAGVGMALQAIFNMIFGAEVKAVETKYSGMLHMGNVLVSLPKLHEKPILHLIGEEVERLLMVAEDGAELTEVQQRYHRLTKARDYAVLMLF